MGSLYRVVLLSGPKLKTISSKLTAKLVVPARCVYVIRTPRHIHCISPAREVGGDNQQK